MIQPDDPRHGTTRGYHAGCHDACCRRAMARYEKEGRLARLRGGKAIPAIGAQRRLQALLALGWSSHRIATEAGLAHRNHVTRILHGQKGKPARWIQRDTDKWVRDVYERLSMQIPEGPYVQRTRDYAKTRGYRPPLAWDDGALDDPDARPRGYGKQKGRHFTDYDEAVVIRLLDLEPIKATAAEKEEAIRRWVAAGRPARQLAMTHGWKDGRYGKGRSEGSAA